MFDNLNKIKGKIKKSQVVSFDIFDTLLVRPFLTPQNVFAFLEESLKEPNFAEIREKAERDLKLHKNIDYATYDDIYEILPKKFNYIKEIEKEFEKKILFANPDMKLLYDYAKSLNKKIIITSDMYFPPEFLKEVLNKNGYSGFEKIYVSGYEKKAKFNGTLFSHIIKDLKLNPQEILHIGDNTLSDFKMPKQLGIEALRIKSPAEVFFNKYSSLKEFADSNRKNLTAGVIIGQCIKKMITKFKFKNYWDFFGYFWGGPFCYGLSKFIVEEMEKTGRRELICAARDGYTIQKIINLLNPEIRTHYVYASRAINLLTSLDYSNELPWTSKAESIISMFKDYSTQFAKECENQNTNTQESRIKLIEKYRNVLEPVSQSINNAYMEYLNKFDIQDKRIALFDITAGAYNSFKLLRRCLPDKDILGLYWFALENKNFKYKEYSDFSKSHVHNYELLEFIVTAPELPIKSFSTTGKLIRFDNRQERIRMEKYFDVSQGELDWVRDYINTYQTPINFDSAKLSDFINVFCDKYTLKDYLHFMPIKHGMNEIHTRYRNLLQLIHFKNLFGNFIQIIFSIKNEKYNEKVYKVWTILGIRMKFKKTQKGECNARTNVINE